MLRQAVVLKFSSMNNAFVPPQIEDENGGYYPERRLWAAVIVETLAEYEEQLRRIKYCREASPHPVNRIFFQAIKRLRYECEHAWFQNICWLANVEPSSVYVKFDELDAKYQLRRTNFTDMATVIPRERLDRSRKAKILRSN